MTGYHLYENALNQWARVHRDGCRLINLTSMAENKWCKMVRWLPLGKFETTADALTEARKLLQDDYADFAPCVFCLREDK